MQPATYIVSGIASAGITTVSRLLSSLWLDTPETTADEAVQGMIERALSTFWWRAAGLCHHASLRLRPNHVEQRLALLHFDRVQCALDGAGHLLRVFDALAVAACGLADHLEVQRR